jgi:hypothetical protein
VDGVSINTNCCSGTEGIGLTGIIFFCFSESKILNQNYNTATLYNQK